MTPPCTGPPPNPLMTVPSRSPAHTSAEGPWLPCRRKRRLGDGGGDAVTSAAAATAASAAPPPLPSAHVLPLRGMDTDTGQYRYSSLSTFLYLHCEESIAASRHVAWRPHARELAGGVSSFVLGPAVEQPDGSVGGGGSRKGDRGGACCAFGAPGGRGDRGGGCSGEGEGLSSGRGGGVGGGGNGDCRVDCCGEAGGAGEGGGGEGG